MKEGRGQGRERTGNRRRRRYPSHHAAKVDIRIGVHRHFADFKARRALGERHEDNKLVLEVLVDAAAFFDTANQHRGRLVSHRFR